MGGNEQKISVLGQPTLRETACIFFTTDSESEGEE